LPNPGELEKQFTVVVIYQSPGFTSDAGGYQIIVARDVNGNYVLKKIPVGPGPGDPPGYRLLPASVEMLSALEGVAGVDEVRERVFNVMQQAAMAMLRT
jgi:hypothetical protein